MCSLITLLQSVHHRVLYLFFFPVKEVDKEQNKEHDKEKGLDKGKDKIPTSTGHKDKDGTKGSVSKNATISTDTADEKGLGKESVTDNLSVSGKFKTSLLCPVGKQQCKMSFDRSARHLLLP